VPGETGRPVDALRLAPRARRARGEHQVGPDGPARLGYWCVTVAPGGSWKADAGGDAVYFVISKLVDCAATLT